MGLEGTPVECSSGNADGYSRTRRSYWYEGCCCPPVPSPRSTTISVESKGTRRYRGPGEGKVVSSLLLRPSVTGCRRNLLRRDQSFGGLVKGTDLEL